MSALADNVAVSLFGAPHELALLNCRAEGLFLDEYSNLGPWENEVICEGHLNELSRSYFANEYGHVKKMRGSGNSVYACGYPEEHSAQAKRYSMSYQQSKNLLESHGVLVPAGTRKNLHNTFLHFMRAVRVMNRESK